MRIRQFVKNDISTASRMACEVWGHNLAGSREKFKQFVYEYMTRYYFLNPDFSICVEDDEMKAVLFASKKTDKNESDEWFETNVKSFSDDECHLATQYRKYFEENGLTAQKYVGKNDIIICLFVSLEQVCGKLLLKKLEELCRRNEIDNMYLWTDTTCNFSYYSKNGFEKLEQFENALVIDGKQLETLVYRKVISKG